MDWETFVHCTHISDSGRRPVCIGSSSTTGVLGRPGGWRDLYIIIAITKRITTMDAHITIKIISSLSSEPGDGVGTAVRGCVVTVGADTIVIERSPSGPLPTTVVQSYIRTHLADHVPVHDPENDSEKIITSAMSLAFLLKLKQNTSCVEWLRTTFCSVVFWVSKTISTLPYTILTPMLELG